MKQETKDKLHRYIQIAIIIGFVIGSIWVLFKGMAGQEKLNYSLEERLSIIQGNSVEAVSPAYYILETEVLGTLVQTTFPDDVALSELAKKIIKCESNFNTTVCSYKGCQAGMGLFQLIPSTVKYCEEKLGKEIDPFNAQDNLQCGMWLLENEGIRHWKPSQHCWEE